jgi:hypothetical protein
LTYELLLVDDYLKGVEFRKKQTKIRICNLADYYVNGCALKNLRGALTPGRNLAPTGLMPFCDFYPVRNIAFMVKSPTII